MVGPAGSVDGLAPGVLDPAVLDVGERAEDAVCQRVVSLRRRDVDVALQVPDPLHGAHDTGGTGAEHLQHLPPGTPPSHAAENARNGGAYWGHCSWPTLIT